MAASEKKGKMGIHVLDVLKNDFTAYGEKKKQTAIIVAASEAWQLGSSSGVQKESG